jgi:hypothetical protein
MCQCGACWWTEMDVSVWSQIVKRNACVSVVERNGCVSVEPDGGAQWMSQCGPCWSKMDV